MYFHFLNLCTHVGNYFITCQFRCQQSFGKESPNKSPQKHPPYFWSKCYIIVCIILLILLDTI